MVRTHKRSKRTRLRGSRSAGTGFRKKKKGGSGNNGGQGWSGTGKRGSQKQQMALMYAKSQGYETYFGKRGITSASTWKKKNEQINLRDIRGNIFQKDGQKIELKEHKILGEGEGFKAEIYALSASASAIEKMEKAGGKIILPVKKEFVKKIAASVSSEEKVVAKKVPKEPKAEKKTVKK